LFKNSIKARPELTGEVDFLRNYFSKNKAFEPGQNGEFLWQHFTQLQQQPLYVLPYNVNGKFNGFLMLNKARGVPVAEFYNFGKNFKRQGKTLHSKDAFTVNLLLNKIINGTTQYEFSSVNKMPLVFRKFTKIDAQSRKPGPNEKLTVHIETNVETAMAMPYPECETRICTWVETPNFQWVEVCWYQNGCDDQDPWGGFGDDGIYIDPYADPVGGGGGGNTSFDEMVNSVVDSLDLTDAEMLTIWHGDPQSFVELYYYLKNSDQPEKKGIAKSHLDGLELDNGLPNLEYRNFCLGHRQSANNNFLWFEDSTWVDNPNNINFDLDSTNQQYDELTAEEKRLVAIYPRQAVIIRGNVDNARRATEDKMGPGEALNTKKDAFRHAYFNAINTKDCPMNIFPPASAEQIVRKFANAHESEVPAVLILEKQMDLFNNDVGISYASWLFFASDESVANAIKEKLDNGELRYIKPLDNVLSKPYDLNGDGIQDCVTCLNGILPNSVLAPTNL
jgi:hypothetical protein